MVSHLLTVSACIVPPLHLCWSIVPSFSALPKYLSDDIEIIRKLALRIILPFITYDENPRCYGLSSLQNRRGSCLTLFPALVTVSTVFCHQGKCLSIILGIVMFSSYTHESLQGAGRLSIYKFIHLVTDYSK